jgi:hypothetical protein
MCCLIWTCGISCRSVSYVAMATRSRRTTASGDLSTMRDFLRSLRAQIPALVLRYVKRRCMRTDCETLRPAMRCDWSAAARQAGGVRPLCGTVALQAERIGLGLRLTVTSPSQPPLTAADSVPLGRIVQPRFGGGHHLVRGPRVVAGCRCAPGDAHNLSDPLSTGWFMLMRRTQNVGPRQGPDDCCKPSSRMCAPSSPLPCTQWDSGTWDEVVPKQRIRWPPATQDMTVC